MKFCPLLTFNRFVYLLIFLIGALNYALMLGTLELITGGFPVFASLDLLRTEGSFFLFVGFCCACYLVTAKTLLWVRRLVTLFLCTVLLFFAHMAAVLAQITAEAGPIEKVLFYSNYLKLPWLSNHTLEPFLLYGIPGFVFFGLVFIYFFCLKNPEDVYLRKPFRRNCALALAFLLLGFIQPLQTQMPYSLSHNALLYVLKSGYFPQAQYHIHDAQAAYPAWVFEEKSPAVHSQKNIVLVILESFREDSVGRKSIDGKHSATPFLDQLASQSTVYKKAYGSVPHTSKALVGIHCGIFPVLDLPIFESIYGLPVNCLPALLQERGYHTAFFQGATGKYENRRELLSVFGYQHQVTAESFTEDAVQKVNPLGVDEFSMLEKSTHWLGEHKHEPFLLTYLTLATHHPYDVSHLGHNQHYHEVPLVNNYLNAVRYTDSFVEQLIDVFKREDIYSNSIFIFVSDHGEAFGEHGEQLHNNVAYNEVAQVFMMIHDPDSLQEKQEHAAVSQLQILPTVMELLGYPSKQDALPVSLNHKTGEALGSCYEKQMCLYYVKENYKYIYNFREKTPELFDIYDDPKELNNLIKTHPEIAEDMHHTLMTYYSFHQSALHNFYSQSNPDYLDDLGATVLYSIDEMRKSIQAVFGE